MTTNGPLNRKLRMALVGGGQGSFIGRVHCIAAVLDNRASLVAGALSSNPERAKASAVDYDIPPQRAYGSVSEMLEKERNEHCANGEHNGEAVRQSALTMSSTGQPELQTIRNRH